MGQSAAEQFFVLASNGRLPATLPIDSDGDRGLVTIGFELATPKACQLVYSGDHKDRARAAIHAILDAGEVVEDRYSDITIHPPLKKG